MKAKKKNRFLTFCVSLIPGAGEMYMGFMKTGLSIMLTFFFTIALAAFFNLGALGSLCIVVWFYGFFHANHLASLSDEEFVLVEDRFFIEMDTVLNSKSLIRKYHQWIAGILIFMGCWLLLSMFGDFAYSFLPEAVSEVVWRINRMVPQIVFAVIIIVVGINMIKGRNAQLSNIQKDDRQTEGAQEVDTSINQNGNESEIR